MKYTGVDLLEKHASRTVPNPYSETVVVLDSVRSMHNVGSIFRSCDALSVSKLLLTGITPCPPRPEISKSALGAESTVPFQHFKDASNSIEMLKSDGYLIFGIEQTSRSTDLDQQEFPKHKTAFVFGNEVHGVSDKVLDLCDQVLEIPQFGKKHSFNVSVSVGIVLFHYLSTFRR
jgi:tRNA G18 (ribose-2'-O)-methylase SpoU